MYWNLAITGVIYEHILLHVFHVKGIAYGFFLLTLLIKMAAARKSRSLRYDFIVINNEKSISSFFVSHKIAEKVRP